MSTLAIHQRKKKTQRIIQFNRSFKNSLQQLITDKMKTFDIDFESNPLLKQNYNALPIDIKVSCLVLELKEGTLTRIDQLTRAKSCIYYIH